MKQISPHRATPRKAFQAHIRKEQILYLFSIPSE